MKYYVKYKIVGFNGEQKAGPYPTSSEAEYQKWDIEGYEGVYGAHIVEEQEAPKTMEPYEEGRVIDLT